MRVPRIMIGKRVEVHWIDPCSTAIESRLPKDHSDVARGKAALSKWKTRGVIEFIEDDVVSIQKAIAEDVNESETTTNRLEYDHVPEALIFRIIETPDATIHGEPLPS
jgi:hypothetical protein